MLFLIIGLQQLVPQRKTHLTFNPKKMLGSSCVQYVLEDQEDLYDNNLDPQSKHHLSRQEDIDHQQSTYDPSTLLSTYKLPPAQLERGNQQQFKSSQSSTPRVPNPVLSH